MSRVIEPRALLLTEVAHAPVLADLCAFMKIDAKVAPTGVGSMAIIEDVNSAAAAASTLSAHLPQAGILLLRALDQQVDAQMWLAGELHDRPSPGVIFNEAPEEVERYLLGQLSLSDLDRVIDTAQIGRFKALRSLRKLMKDQKKQPRGEG